MIKRRPLYVALAVLLATGSCAVAVLSCTETRSKLIGAFTPTYKPSGDPSNLNPTFDGPDAALPRIAISLETVAEGFSQITDLQFPPGESELAIVLQKEGEARWTSFADRKQGTFFKQEVLTASEEGLLGLAFHPKFSQNGRFFVNAVVKGDSGDESHIDEWKVAPGEDLRTATPRRVRTLLSVHQPYPNHDAGQLAFGPDGFLYIGFGDGGSGGDPHGNGQNPATLLGAMLRIDVDHQADGKPYAIPADNPFLGREGFLPELWAMGLRNPWRYSFAPDGRLIVADVGQDTWEEIDLVKAGDNLGWNIREARHCFEPKTSCRTEGLVDPIYEYGRDTGSSITGGYVYTGSRVPELAGKYLFADFVSGRIRALDLPAQVSNDAPLANAWALGRWPLLIASFGRDARGEVYVTDFSGGKVYRIAPAASTTADAGTATP